MSVESHAINLFDGDLMFREFMNDIGVRLDRLQSQGVMPEAIAIREDLWPGMIRGATIYGYPIVRLAASSATIWGVLA